MFFYDPPNADATIGSNFEFTAFRREFDGAENKIYAGATLKGTLPGGRKFSLTYNDGKRSNVTFPGVTLATGGKDVEAMLYDNNEEPGAYRFDFGVSYSETASRPKRTHFIANVSRHQEEDMRHTYVAASAIVGGPTIAFAKAGIELGSDETGEGFFELGIPFAASNSLSTIDGRGIRVPIYSAGWRKASGGMIYELAYTNRIGTTTGFGLTPSVDNKGAFSLSLGVRF